MSANCTLYLAFSVRKFYIFGLFLVHCRTNTKSLITMTKTATNLLGILTTILAGTYFYVTCCNNCGMTVKKELSKEAAVTLEKPEAKSSQFAFSDGDYIYEENNNYNSKMSSSSILLPLSNKVSIWYYKPKRFLK